MWNTGVLGLREEGSKGGEDTARVVKRNRAMMGGAGGVFSVRKAYLRKDMAWGSRGADLNRNGQKNPCRLAKEVVT